MEKATFSLRDTEADTAVTHQNRGVPARDAAEISPKSANTSTFGNSCVCVDAEVPCGSGTAASSGKKTLRSDSEKKKLTNRLSRLEGQIRGIRGMIEKDAYCNDVLIQSAAASAALAAFERELLGAHVKGCVARDLRNGHDEVIDELLETISKLMK